MASSDSQIDKPQGGCPKGAELPDVTINRGVQSINTEKASLFKALAKRTRKSTQVLDVRSTCVSFGHPLASTCINLRGLAWTSVDFGQIWTQDKYIFTSHIHRILILHMIINYSLGFLGF